MIAGQRVRIREGVPVFDYGHLAGQTLDRLLGTVVNPYSLYVEVLLDELGRVVLPQSFVIPLSPLELLARQA